MATMETYAQMVSGQQNNNIIMPRLSIFILLLSF